MYRGTNGGRRGTRLGTIAAMGHFLLKSAVHVFFVRCGEVLLLRRFNTGYQDGYYSVPAGHLDGGETVGAAAAREAGEETGVRLDAAQVQVVGVMHRRSDDERIDFFVAVTDWQGEPHNAEPEKCDDLRWFPLASLPENTIPYVRQALANYTAGRWFDEFGWEDA